MQEAADDVKKQRHPVFNVESRKKEPRHPVFSTGFRILILDCRVATLLAMTSFFCRHCEERERSAAEVAIQK